MRPILMVLIVVGLAGCERVVEESVLVSAIREIERLGGTVYAERGVVYVDGLSSGGTGPPDHGWDDDDFSTAYPHLLQLGRIDKLELSASRVSDKSLVLVSRIPRLRAFWMQSPGGQITDDGVGALMNSRDLESLYITKPELKWTGLKDIQELAKLRDLTIGADLTDDVIAFLSGHPALERLSIGGPHITNKSVAIICSLRKLTTLTLSSVSVDDSGFERLGDAPALQIVNTPGSRQITDVGILKLRRIRPQMQIGP